MILLPIYLNTTSVGESKILILCYYDFLTVRTMAGRQQFTFVPPVSTASNSLAKNTIIAQVIFFYFIVCHSVSLYWLGEKINLSSASLCDTSCMRSVHYLTVYSLHLDISCVDRGEERLLAEMRVCCAETVGCQSIWVWKVLQLSQTVCISVLCYWEKWWKGQEWLKKKRCESIVGTRKGRQT